MPAKKQTDQEAKPELKPLPPATKIKVIRPKVPPPYVYDEYTNWYYLTKTVPGRQEPLWIPYLSAAFVCTGLLHAVFVGMTTVPVILGDFAIPAIWTSFWALAWMFSCAWLSTNHYHYNRNEETIKEALTPMQVQAFLKELYDLQAACDEMYPELSEGHGFAPEVPFKVEQVVPNPDYEKALAERYEKALAEQVVNK